MTKILNLEIFSVGTHTDSQGLTESFTPDDVDHMVDMFGQGKPEFVPVKVGHSSDEFNQKIAEQMNIPPAMLTGDNGGLDGVIALGQVVSLRRTQNKLVADLEVPEQLAEVFKQYFRDVSCELSKDGEGRWILDGLAMLSAERPAVGNLAGLAAAAVLTERRSPAFVASMPLTERVEMTDKTDNTGLLNSITGVFRKELGESITFSELGESLKLNAETPDKAAVKDAIAQLQDRSDMLDQVVSLLQQAMEITAAAATEGEEIVEDEIADDPVPAMSALVGRISAFKSNGGDVQFKDSAEFKSLVNDAVKTATKELEATVAKLRGDAQVTKWSAQTEKLVGIEGEPSELAQKLVDIESTSGEEAAQTVLSAWQTASKFAQEAGVTSSIGDSIRGEGEESSKFEQEAAEYRKENPGTSEAEALSIVRLRAMRKPKKQVEA